MTRIAETIRAIRAVGAANPVDFYRPDSVVGGYARFLTRHWASLTSRVADYVAGEGTGSAQWSGSLGAGGEQYGSGKMVSAILGTPVVTRVLRRALRGEEARQRTLDPVYPQPLSYRESDVCEDGEFSVIAAFRAAQVNAKELLSTLDAGLRTPWESAAMGVDL